MDEPSETTNLLGVKVIARTNGTVYQNGNSQSHHGTNRNSNNESCLSVDSSILGEYDTITLTWENINCYIPSDDVKTKWSACCSKGKVGNEPRQILKNVSGVAKPGTLLAILGASGSGKTTLLNVLNQRRLSKMTVDGDLRVNGLSLGGSIAAVSGYVQQDDLFIASLKTREHLVFQAMLRMDKHIPTKTRLERVEEVIKELGLTKCADSMIGGGRIVGISGGERKRLGFASEVLTNPALLFCDEPTSGLDSFMAENIIQNLKNLAVKGKTIVCTIHQPSSQVYALFDRILLLAEGHVAYLGPTSGISNFFESTGNSCPPNFNPADYFIHTLAIVLGRETDCKHQVQKVCDAYEKSVQFDEVKSDIRKAVAGADEMNDVVVKRLKNLSPYKASWWVQFRIVLWRSWLTNVREPALMRSRLSQSVLSAVIFGLIYLRQANDQKGVMNINGAIFLFQTQMSFGSLFSVVHTIPLEFPVFMREHHSGMYRSGVYYISKMLAELPIFFLMPILFTSIAYWMIGLYDNAETFLIAMLTLLIVANVAVAFGYLMSCSTSNAALAVGMAPMVLIPFMLFGGFFLNNGSVPVYLIWLKYISWFSYSNEILIVNQWRYVTNITCEYGPHGPDLLTTIMSLTSMAPPTTPPHTQTGGGPRCFPNGKAVIDSLSFHEDNVLMDFVILIGLLMAFRVLSFLILFARSRKRE